MKDNIIEEGCLKGFHRIAKKTPKKQNKTPKPEEGGNSNEYFSFWVKFQKIGCHN